MGDRPVNQIDVPLEPCALDKAMASGRRYDKAVADAAKQKGQKR